MVTTDQWNKFTMTLSKSLKIQGSTIVLTTKLHLQLRDLLTLLRDKLGAS
jgi:hypothetical protein